MDLKEFISMTLIQIVEGVADSAARAAELGGSVSPAFSAGSTGKHIGYKADGSNQPVYGIEFDVAVVASSNTSAEGGAKLTIATVFSAGGKAGEAAKEETTSRIRFLVPLSLPTDPISKEAADKRKQEDDARLGIRPTKRY